MRRLTHVDAGGAARMVDVGAKAVTSRRATARARVRFGATSFRLLRENRLAKGDALAVARLAGIQAGKRTAEWIPLCHAVPLDHLDVRIELKARGRTAEITAEAAARWTTGVEMEALVAGEALPVFDKQMRGYLSEEAVLVGVESRTSSPVRVPLDSERLEAPDLAGLYPCGEGAGYAGGIVSAALDGVRVARAIIDRQR